MQVGYGLIHGLGGASIALNLGTLCYITDITTEVNRTTRVGILFVTMMLSTPLGSTVSPLMYQLGGYYAAFGLGTACTFTSFLYILFFIRESVETESHQGSKMRDMVRLTHILDCVKTVLKKREGFTRAKIIVLITLMFFCQFYFGEMSIMFLFVYNVFGFDIIRYSWYNTFRFLVNLLGMALTLGVARILGVPDQ